MPEDPVKLAEEIIPQEEKPSIGNVFDDLKERISSPFIFSFIFSWLISNWKILIGLFLYNSEDLRQSNYDNHIDFVEKNLNWINSLAIPLCSALVYCFAYPYLRDYIKVKQAEFTTKTNKKISAVAKVGTVPMLKFIKLKEDYGSLIETTQKLLADESKISEENTSLNAEVVKLRTQINLTTKSLQTWEQWNEVSIIGGIWDMLYVHDSLLKAQVIIIDDEFNYFGSDATDRLLITNFYSNPNKKSISFQTINKTKSDEIDSYNLIVDESWSTMTGVKGANISVVFKKQEKDKALQNAQKS